MKRFAKIKKIITLGLLGAILVGCSSDDINKTCSGKLTDISTEVNDFIKEGKDTNYKNLKFVCKNAYIPEGEYIYKLNYDIQNINDIPITEENVEKLKNIAKGLMDYEEFDDGKFYFHDWNQKVPEMALDDERLSEYEKCPVLFYCDYDNYRKVEINAYCIYFTKGKIGKLVDAHSAFLGLEDNKIVKKYDCISDDLSDIYELEDGKKSIKEIREIMENYFNSLDVCGNKSGKIKDFISEIDVYKLDSEDINIIHATRTFSYNNIPFRVMTNNGGISPLKEGETATMADVYMIDGSTVDVSLGLMNTCKDVEEIEKYEKIKSFEDIVTSVSTYLAGQSIFNVQSISLEYRVFATNNDDLLEAVPYWKFVTENQTDKKKTIVYVDLMTGEATGYVVNEE